MRRLSLSLKRLYTEKKIWDQKQKFYENQKEAFKSELENATRFSYHFLHFPQFFHILIYELDWT